METRDEIHHSRFVQRRGGREQGRCAGGDELGEVGVPNGDQCDGAGGNGTSHRRMLDDERGDDFVDRKHDVVGDVRDFAHRRVRADADL